MSKQTIGIIGTGKLGICMALLFERAGYEVIGVDVHQDYVDSINNKSFSSSEKGVNESLMCSTHFRATTQIDEVLKDHIDVLLLVVPTTTSSEMVYTYVAAEQVLRDLEAHGRRSKPIHFVIVSTAPPGYCEKISARVSSLNYQLIYHPEFIAQGTIMENLCSPDILLIGREATYDTSALEEMLYTICVNEPQLHAMSLLSAEITKLSLNCFLTMKIAFANSIGDLSIQVGAEHEKVLSAIAGDKRIKAKYLGYGFGYGGPCLPRDNQALNSYAMQVGSPLYLSAATQLANKAHLLFQKAQYLARYKPQETIIFEGVTYKAETDLIEKSQSLALARLLAEEGRKVLIRERAQVIQKIKEEYPDLFQFEYIEEPSQILHPTQAVSSL